MNEVLFEYLSSLKSVDFVSPSWNVNIDDIDLLTVEFKSIVKNYVTFNYIGLSDRRAKTSAILLDNIKDTIRDRKINKILE